MLSALSLRHICTGGLLSCITHGSSAIAARCFSNVLSGAVLKQMKSSYEYDKHRSLHRNRRHEELSRIMEKSTDLSREEYTNINHELSSLYEKYDCYKKYIVGVARVFDGVEGKEGDRRGKGVDC